MGNIGRGGGRRYFSSRDVNKVLKIQTLEHHSAAQTSPASQAPPSYAKAITELEYHRVTLVQEGVQDTSNMDLHLKRVNVRFTRNGIKISGHAIGLFGSILRLLFLGTVGVLWVSESRISVVSVDGTFGLSPCDRFEASTSYPEVSF